MIELYKGDCLIESDKIESGSVDLILTDLPYGTVKDLYENTSWDVVIDTTKIMQIADRILRINGKMILFAQEPFTTELKEKLITNIKFHQRLIWEKDSSGNMLFSKKACVNFYEDILVFSKDYESEVENKDDLRHYFSELLNFIDLRLIDINKKLNNRNAEHTFYKSSNQFRLCTEKTYNQLIEVFNIDSFDKFISYKDLKEIDLYYKNKFASTFNLWQGKKYKSNILKYKKDYDGHHPTQKPVLLLEDLIKTFSNEGDLVVDLTMGSGSTGVAAQNTNRNFVGIEMNDGYFEIAKKRIEKAKLKKAQEIDFN